MSAGGEEKRAGRGIDPRRRSEERRGGWGEGSDDESGCETRGARARGNGESIFRYLRDVSVRARRAPRRR